MYAIKMGNYTSLKTARGPEYTPPTPPTYLVGPRLQKYGLYTQSPWAGPSYKNLDNPLGPLEVPSGPLGHSLSDGNLFQICTLIMLINTKIN